MSFAEAARIISLGGIGDFGKNMTLIVHPDCFFAIDCGLMFPDENHPGVDVILPDMTFVLENKEYFAGVVLTHGHEDHLGGLPYLMEQMPVKVFGTRLTLGILEAKLQEFHPVAGSEFIEMMPGERLRLGSFEVELVRVSHSIPEGMGLLVRTMAGDIFHSGDFKFDQTPIDSPGPDFQRLARMGEEGLLCLLSDCTNVEQPGYSPSERLVGERLRHLLREAPGRVIITTFASHLSRIQQVLDQSRATGRRVAVTGRSMERLMEVGLRLGYLQALPELIIDISEIDELPPRELTILTTGSQGEPLSALARMSRGTHRYVKIQAGDTVVMSARPIPGNESLIWRVINDLFAQGARVVYGSEQGVHVSGHGYREEIKLMLSLTRPRYAIPIHGDQRHLVLYADLAEEMGLPRENVFLLRPGASVELQRGKAYRAANVPAGAVNVDGLGVGDVGDIVLNDRLLLAAEGIFLPVLVVEQDTFRLLAPPDFYSRGFVYMEEAEELKQAAQEVVYHTHHSFLAEGGTDPVELYDRIKGAVAKFLYELTGRRPLVLPVIVPVAAEMLTPPASQEDIP